MRLSLSEKALASYVARQISNFLPDGIVEPRSLNHYVERALERTEYCFSRVNAKYYYDGDQVLFNHLNTDQYAVFLYYLSNTIWRLEGDVALAGKVYCLNKALHALDAFYEVELPDIFKLQHPVGTVLGRGKYSNYFVAYQRCSIGANLSDEYPILGEGLVMYGGSAIIGNCRIHGNCWISVGTIVMDMDIPPNRVVFGRYPNTACKETSRNVIEKYFFVR